jgi:Domain of unknown function (DUF397)
VTGSGWRKSSHSVNNLACVEVGWGKSTYSHPANNCVEVGYAKSSHSANNGACVEAGTGACGMVHVRDSKDPSGPVLSFTRAEWAQFLAGLR